jgi:site-specific DNA-methyltransferase (adenine-specific)
MTETIGNIPGANGPRAKFRKKGATKGLRVPRKSASLTPSDTRTILSAPMHERSPRNKTVTLSPDEERRFGERLIRVENFPTGTADSASSLLGQITDRVINADLFEALPFLPRSFADMVFIDPPYNLDKNFHGMSFRGRSTEEYLDYVESWLPAILACAKETASIYVCCDWKSSGPIFAALERRCVVRNRITWQREKGRGAEHNWKNSSEDIWFATMGEDFYFDVDSVMHRKKVIAPYRENGKPKDWAETPEGKFRLTYPSNFWDDITVPYWSMSENTEHPTQKPEKLLAKLILASSPPGALLFDPFAGSGTTAVAAKKLGRHFVSVEQNRRYCLWAEKRLESAESDKTIQGYVNGAFTERNSRS